MSHRQRVVVKLGSDAVFIVQLTVGDSVLQGAVDILEDRKHSANFQDLKRVIPAR